MRRPMCESCLAPFRNSEISRIIGQIFAVDGVTVFNVLVGSEPLNSILRKFASRS